MFLDSLIINSWLMNGLRIDGMLAVPPLKTLNANNEQGVPICGIERHRLLTDGKGVTSLVGFSGCPLNCKYCINPECHDKRKVKLYSLQSLYEKLKVDDLYFQATGGGVIFGGGEPCLYSDFIKEFKYIYGRKWKIGLETSLNVPIGNVEKLGYVVDEWIIDIKDMNCDIYKQYTGMPNDDVVKNLKFLATNIDLSTVTIRTSLIPNYNSEDNINESKQILSSYGFKKFDTFEYIENIDIKYEHKNTGKYGKAICDVLKEIRKEIVKANNINISIKDCTHEKCLIGSCPVCDLEAQKIMEELYRKQLNNEQIFI